MKENLTAALKKIAIKLLENNQGESVFELQEQAKELYEKLTILAFVEQQNELTPEKTPSKDTIKEVPSVLDENLFVAQEDVFVEKTASEIYPSEEMFEVPQENTTQKKTSINDQLKKGITIGLNDRIAFVKHLFNESSEDFNRVMSQLNTLKEMEEVLVFLNDMVKPEYNNWEGKDAYETRFIAILETRF